MKKRVLFICEHNSARSQIAAAYLHKYGSDDYDVESAGLEPTELNPLAVAVMREAGIDISDQKPQSVFGLFKLGKLYQTIITVCQPAADKCPIFPGVAKGCTGRSMIRPSLQEPGSRSCPKHGRFATKSRTPSKNGYLKTSDESVLQTVFQIHGCRGFNRISGLQNKRCEIRNRRIVSSTFLTEI